MTTLWMMIIVAVISGNIRIGAKFYPDQKSCEDDKPAAMQSAVAANVDQVGLSCTSIVVGKPT